jgi:hypothetical protein
MRPIARRSSSVSSLALVLVAATTSFALALVMLACAGTFARADGTPGRIIPPQEVAGRLAVRGYVVSAPVIRRGTAYLTHGTDKWGQRLRLVMDARNGEIIGLRILSEPRAPHRDGRASRP